MSLAQSLSTAVAGLNVTQQSLSIVAANVANAQTPGYVTKNAIQITTTAGNAGDSVRVSEINRSLDPFVQKLLWSETSGGAYADLRSTMFKQLQQTYGQPGSGTSLDALFNNLTTAVQTLSATPESSSAQTGVIGAAQALAQQLNGMTRDIQGLRSQAEQGISTDVQQANDALNQIASINQQLVADGSNDSTAAALTDQRDQAITQLAKVMDIRVAQGNNNQVAVFTGSGYELVGTQAAKLDFSAQGTITAAQVWNSDPTKSTLGSITLVTPDGGRTDLLANGGIRSGELAAYIDMRDRTLVQAQSQVDEIAGQMSRTLSDKTTPGAAVVGPPSGYDVDVGSLSAGNTIQLTYTDTATNTQHKVTVIRVDDPAALPLSDTVTPDPNDKVVGVNFSGGIASVVSQLNFALGNKGLQFSNPAGTTVRVVSSNNSAIVNAVSTTATATTLTGGSGQLPLFVDGGLPFTGAFTASGAEITGFAGRIAVNPGIVANPATLVTYQTAPPTPAGDATRPNFIYNQLTKAVLTYSPSTGLGAVSTPFSGTLSSFTSQMVSQQSQAANDAANLKQGQDIVVNALQQRFNNISAVNIDTEMAHLITLQTTYGANARVMSAVKQMLDQLLQAI